MNLMPEGWIMPVGYSPTDNAGLFRPVWGNNGRMAIKFHVEKLHNEMKSVELGLEVNDSVEFISKFIDAHTVLARPLTEKDKYEYPALYERFKRNLGSEDLEIPEWKAISSGDVAFLAQKGIHTVGQLANHSEEEAARLGRTGKELWEKARRYEKAKTKNKQVDVENVVGELKARNELLEERLARLENAPVVTKSKPRGRPFKKKESAKQDTPL